MVYSVLNVIVVIALAFLFGAMFVIHRRDIARSQRKRALQVLGWRADERDRAAQFGKDMFAKTGDPDYDPDNYDSTWEYAQAMRDSVELTREWVDIDVSPTTVERDGVRHRVARLVINGFSVPTLLCNPDLLQSRVDKGERQVTCLRCLTKEMDEADA